MRGLNIALVGMWGKDDGAGEFIEASTESRKSAAVCFVPFQPSLFKRRQP